MKRILLGTLAFTAMAVATSLSAQTPAPAPSPAATPAPAPVSAPTLTADDIVNKYVDAIGGKDAIAKTKSMSVEGTMLVMGSEAPTTTTVVDGVGMKQVSEFNGAKIINCYTDKGGWMVNPMAGVNSPAAMPDDQYNSGKDAIYVGGPLYNYAARGGTIQLAGKDDKAYSIKLTTKDKAEYTFVIDAKTYLLTAMTSTVQMQGQPVTLTTYYSDYRKTDTGFLVPYGLSLDFGQFQLGITVKTVELNKTIDPATFDMPKA